MTLSSPLFDNNVGISVIKKRKRTKLDQDLLDESGLDKDTKKSLRMIRNRRKLTLSFHYYSHSPKSNRFQESLHFFFYIQLFFGNLFFLGIWFSVDGDEAD